MRPVDRGPGCQNVRELSNNSNFPIALSRNAPDVQIFFGNCSAGDKPRPKCFADPIRY